MKNTLNALRHVLLILLFFLMSPLTAAGDMSGMRLPHANHPLMHKVSTHTMSVKSSTLADSISSWVKQKYAYLKKNTKKVVITGITVSAGLAAYRLGLFSFLGTYFVTSLPKQHITPLEDDIKTGKGKGTNVDPTMKPGKQEPVVPLIIPLDADIQTKKGIEDDIKIENDKEINSDTLMKPGKEEPVVPVKEVPIVPAESPEVTNAKQAFPLFFDSVPIKHHEKVASYLKNHFPFENNAPSNFESMTYLSPIFNIFNYCMDGWIFMEGGLLKGTRDLRGDLSSYQLKHYLTAERIPFFKPPTTEEGRRILSILVQDYKVHLMPKGNVIPYIILLLDLIKNDPQLQEAIAKIKCKMDDTSDKVFAAEAQKNSRPILAKVVIYTTTQEGKKHTQYVVDTLYEYFKDIQGLDITPRYNKKITSFLYVAHGNGDDKVGSNDEFFNTIGKVYDDSGVYFKHDVTGVSQDYKIVNPNKS